jgi:ATP-binding cassette subfamily F protein 3
VRRFAKADPGSAFACFANAWARAAPPKPSSRSTGDGGSRIGKTVCAEPASTQGKFAIIRGNRGSKETMTTLLLLQDAYKRYGDRILLDDTGFQVTSGSKVGVIGRNGSGKTTLCRILIGDEELDSGALTRHRDLRLGYLRQDDPYLPGETVIAFLLRDSQRPEWRCAEVAARFEIRDAALSNPVAELSGGWQTRVKLASLLLHEPNFLILDEPTNFLDLRHKLLLERFLADYTGACLVVSHDRTFLERICDQTLEIARGRLTLFTGNVSAFLDHKRVLREHAVKMNAATLAKRKQLQRFIDKNRANPKTATQARSKQKQLDRLVLLDLEASEATGRLHVPAVDARKGPALRCSDLAIGYPGLDVARSIDLEIARGSRVVVVGDNGQGKTTFLRTAARALEPRRGEVWWHHGADMGYYAQLVYSDLPDPLTVLEYLERCTSPQTPALAVRNVAGNFLFQGDDVDKKVAVLSGGERARLCLAGLLLGGHNVLILDEPGNHLDVEAVEALAEALIHYRGTILFTSHDRHFMERVATDVVEVRDGRVANHPGGYDAYLYSVTQEIAEGEGTSAPRRKKQEASPNRKAEARKLFERKKTLRSLERKLDRLESRRRDLEARLPSACDLEESGRIDGELKAVKRELAEVEERWLKLQENLESS